MSFWEEQSAPRAEYLWSEFSFIVVSYKKTSNGNVKKEKVNPKVNLSKTSIVLQNNFAGCHRLYFSFCFFFEQKKKSEKENLFFSKQSKVSFQSCIFFKFSIKKKLCFVAAILEQDSYLLTWKKSCNIFQIKPILGVKGYSVLLLEIYKCFRNAAWRQPK